MGNYLIVHCNVKLLEPKDIMLHVFQFLPVKVGGELHTLIGVSLGEPLHALAEAYDLLVGMNNKF
jgi:hypothetical protein